VTETESNPILSHGSGFEPFVDLGAVGAASVPSRAFLLCPVKESRPMFPHEAGQSKDGAGEQKRDGEGASRLKFTKKDRASSEYKEKAG
jgi:hypothetical protein